MKTLALKSQAFMHCTYDDPAEYITEEWLKDKDNLDTIMKLLMFSIADDIKGIANETYTGADAVAIESNIKFDFALLKALKEVSNNVQTV